MRPRHFTGLRKVSRSNRHEETVCDADDGGSSQGEFFPESLMQAINARFHHVDRDIDGRKRLFFDNAGGSFRLKTAVDTYARIDAMPDWPERIHDRSRYLQDVQAQTGRRGADIPTPLQCAT